MAQWLWGYRTCNRQILVVVVVVHEITLTTNTTHVYLCINDNVWSGVEVKIASTMDINDGGRNGKMTSTITTEVEITSSDKTMKT